jgi:hypothetical protein
MIPPPISIKVCESSPIPEEEIEDIPEKVDRYANIQKGIRESASLTIAEINGYIDDWSRDKPTQYESVHDILVKMDTKQPQAKLALDHFSPLLAEVTDLKARTCPDLNEAYSFMSRPEINKFVGFIQSVLDDIDRYISNKKQTVVRKPRKKKAKSADKIVAGIKYLPAFPELKIVSVPPQSIVGAESAWLYNVRQRMLTQLIAGTRAGLSIKGSTVIDYDVDNSVKKKVRKPEIILPKVLDGGKVILRKLMEGINSKPQQLTGRINSDTIILRTIK